MIPSLETFFFWAVPVVFAVVLHEIAHGLVAYACGDSTARDAGRLTLNPIPHVDPVGTLLIPAVLILTGAPFLFGYAKPVPVNFRALRHPKRDMVLVAAAGPLTNLALAFVFATLFKAWFDPSLPVRQQSLGAAIALRSVGLNVGLAVFNLLPILPLDGGRVLAGLLPLRQAVAFSRLERYGMPILMVLLMTDSLGRIIAPVMTAVLHVLL